MEKPTVNQREARTANFGSFYKYEGEESHLVPLMFEYQFVDIQYIWDIKKNTQARKYYKAQH